MKTTSLLVAAIALIACFSLLAYAHTNQEHGNNGFVTDGEKHGNNGFVTATWEAAKYVDAGVYVNASTKGRLTWGVLISVPSWDVVLSLGDDIVDGIFWAPAGLVVEIAGDPCPRLETLESVVVGFGGPVTHGGTVACQDGYYACCFCFGGCTYGKCYKNGTPITAFGCQFGGEGVESCSISRDDCNAVGELLPAAGG